jgi:hypothetical protein
MSWWSSLSGKESSGARAASPPLEQQIAALRNMEKQQNDENRRICDEIERTTEEDRVVSVMIEQITQFSGININRSDPLIRFIIKKIILVNGFTGVAIEKIRRCRPLLYAISNEIAPDAQGLRDRATTWLQDAPGRLQRALVFTGRQTALLTGQCLVRGAEFISDRFSNMTHRVFQSRQPSPQGRGAQSPERGSPRGRSRSPPQEAVQNPRLDFVTRALSGLYGVLSRILRSVSGGIERLQAITAAAQVAPVAPAAPAECAICMEPAYFIGENDIEYGPLGYIERHRNGAVGHPDRFHQSCLQGCQNRCPMCRAEGPIWGRHPPPGQGGGGLKRYRSKSRSKSKSKSKSKSRRYISKPRKSRKAGKRIRHASSRRK